jgi:hypothetical protein
MLLRLSLIHTDASQAVPKSDRNSPTGTGDRGAGPPSFPTLIQDEPMLACAPGVHADLAAVIAAWPTLSEDVRATILRLIAGEAQI